MDLKGIQRATEAMMDAYEAGIFNEQSLTRLLNERFSPDTLAEIDAKFLAYTPAELMVKVSCDTGVETMEQRVLEAIYEDVMC